MFVSKGFGFRVSGLGFRFWGLRVKDFEFMAEGLGFRDVGAYGLW